MIAVLAYLTGSLCIAALACGHSAEAMWDVLTLMTRRLRPRRRPTWAAGRARARRHAHRTRQHDYREAA